MPTENETIPKGMINAIKRLLCPLWILTGVFVFWPGIASVTAQQLPKQLKEEIRPLVRKQLVKTGSIPYTRHAGHSMVNMAQTGPAHTPPDRLQAYLPGSPGRIFTTTQMPSLVQVRHFEISQSINDVFPPDLTMPNCHTTTRAPMDGEAGEDVLLMPSSPYCRPDTFFHLPSIGYDDPATHTPRKTGLSRKASAWDPLRQQFRSTGGSWMLQAGAFRSSAGKVHLAFAAGTAPGYSLINTAMLAMLMEEVSKKTCIDLPEARLSEHLHLEQTTRPAMIIKNKAFGAFQSAPGLKARAGDIPHLRINWIVGALSGYRVFTGFSADHQSGVIIFTNTESPVDQIGFEKLRYLP